MQLMVIVMIDCSVQFMHVVCFQVLLVSCQKQGSKCSQPAWTTFIAARGYISKYFLFIYLKF